MKMSMIFRVEIIVHIVALRSPYVLDALLFAAQVF